MNLRINTDFELSVTCFIRHLWLEATETKLVHFNRQKGNVLKGYRGVSQNLSAKGWSGSWTHKKFVFLSLCRSSSSFHSWFWQIIVISYSVHLLKKGHSSRFCIFSCQETSPHCNWNLPVPIPNSQRWNPKMFAAYTEQLIVFGNQMIMLK